MDRVVSQKNRLFSNGMVNINLYTLTSVLIVCIFFAPDYIGVSFLNLQRICLLVIWYLIFRDRKRRNTFLTVIANVRYNVLFLLYVAVLFVTALARMNPNTLLNPLFDQLAIFYTVLYLFKSGYPIEKFNQLLVRITYILCLMGIFEYVTKFSIFTKFEFIKGLTTGEYIRSGSYRIFGPAHHPLGYGLFLILMLAIICYKEKSGLSLFHRPFGVVLILTNTIMTGSRSTMGILLLALALVAIFSTRKSQVLFLSTLIIGIVISLTVLFFNTEPVQSLLSKFSLVVDAAFNTNLASNFDTEDMLTYKNSSQYREWLPKILAVSWLNPFLGQGNGYQFNWYYEGFHINSIDNYYINQYIKVAYPGLIVQIVIYLSFLISMLKTAVFRRSRLAVAFLISCSCYFLNLYWVDALGTLDYVFFIFAVAYHLFEHTEREKDSNYESINNYGHF
ncbi:O-antigen ligase family protein [Enterococcus sp. AZ109]|uniref:O-antigen ligase family protein n=1 Tax=Enterococcus sp. AZ109 TaxID=2774634 RepID=UPI003F207B65